MPRLVANDAVGAVMGEIEIALRERLEMAGCYPVRRDGEGRDIWFTPHLNRNFALPRGIASGSDANAVLRAAGMEEAF